MADDSTAPTPATPASAGLSLSRSAPPPLPLGGGASPVVSASPSPASSPPAHPTLLLHTSFSPAASPALAPTPSGDVTIPPLSVATPPVGFSPQARRPSLAPPPLPPSNNRASPSPTSLLPPASPAAPSSLLPPASPAPPVTPAPVEEVVVVAEVEVTSIDEEIDPGKTPEERLKRYSFRKKVAQEMLSTEQSYVASLNILQSVYIKALLEEKTGILTAQQGETLFSNIPLLAPFQQQFLDVLKSTLNKWSPTSQEIGAVFLKFAPFFKMYTSYVNNFDSATSLFQKLEKSDSFTSFCGKLRVANPGVMEVQSYCIMPIQRVPRYKLLLAEMLRFTSPQHADFPMLTKAMDVMSSVALHINEAVRKQQNTQALLNLSEKFGGSLQLIGPNTNGVPGGRRLIKRGALSKKGRRSDTRYEFMCFSDFLIYAQPRGSSSFKLHRKIFIDDKFAVSDVPDAAVADDRAAPGDRFCVQVLSAQKSFIVFASSAKEKEDWMACLQEAVADFKKAAEPPAPVAQSSAASGALSPPPGGLAQRRGSLLPTPINSPVQQQSSDSSEFGGTQPVFQQFKSGSVCNLCAARCTFASGRHHCRACGCIVCNACARDRIYLAWTKQCSRTCDRCCQRLKDERSAKLEKLARLAGRAPTSSSSASAAASPTPPAIPARPDQDRLFRLLNELLETAPRIEASSGGTTRTSPNKGLLSPSGGPAKARAMSVFIQPGSKQPLIASPISAPTSIEPVARYQEGAGSERPQVVGRLDFIRPRGGAKTRSHSVLLTGATSLLSPEWENDGLSESDDEGAWDREPLSANSNSVSHNSPHLDRIESGSAATRSRLSFSDTVEEEAASDHSASSGFASPPPVTRASSLGTGGPPPPLPIARSPSATPATPSPMASPDSAGMSPPPIPGRISDLKKRFSMTLGPTLPSRSSQSFSIQASSPSQARQAAQDLMSPQQPSTPGSGRLPPAIPARTVRSVSLIASTPERLEKRRSILGILSNFFSSRPTKEALVAKGVIKA